MNRLTRFPTLAWRHVRNSARLLSYPEKIDAVLVSYPKSGRTWFRFILSSYLNQAFALMSEPDLYTMFGVVPNFDLDPQRGLPAFACRDRQPRPPLIAVSHLSYSRLWFRDFPAIFMLRDPRDVLVSSYFHATRQKHRFSGSMDAFLRDRDHGIAALTGYLNGWAAGLAARRHVVISYEALSRDTHAETARVLGFLGLEVDTQALANAVETARFGNMRELELAKGLPGHAYDRSDQESLRMRRGTVGGFSEYLTPEQIRLIDESCARNLSAAAKALLATAGQQAPSRVQA